MLDKNERLRLAACIDIARSMKEGKLTNDSIKPETTLWLAEKLKECDDELKALYTHTVERLDKVIFPRNPISVKTKEGVKTAAIWDGVPGVYRCIFCDTVTRDEDSAQRHANTHFEDKEPPKHCKREHCSVCGDE